MEEVEEAKKAENFDEAKTLLMLLREEDETDKAQNSGAAGTSRRPNIISSSRSPHIRPSMILRRKSRRSERRAICFPN